MPDMLSASEMATISSDDLYRAEHCFDRIKLRMLKEASGEESLHRARLYLKVIESILDERHEARRARG